MPHGYRHTARHAASAHKNHGAYACAVRFYSYICIEKHFICFILYKKQIMNITDIHVVYFSATYTTRTIVREIAKAIGGNIIEHDVTNALPESEITLSGDNSMLMLALLSTWDAYQRLPPRR